MTYSRASSSSSSFRFTKRRWVGRARHPDQLAATPLRHLQLHKLPPQLRRAGGATVFSNHPLHCLDLKVAVSDHLPELRVLLP